MDLFKCHDISYHFSDIMYLTSTYLMLGGTLAFTRKFQVK